MEIEKKTIKKIYEIVKKLIDKSYNFAVQLSVHHQYYFHLLSWKTIYLKYIINLRKLHSNDIRKLKL